MGIGDVLQLNTGKIFSQAKFSPNPYTFETFCVLCPPPPISYATATMDNVPKANVQTKSRSCLCVPTDFQMYIYQWSKYSKDYLSWQLPFFPFHNKQQQTLSLFREQWSFMRRSCWLGSRRIQDLSSSPAWAPALTGSCSMLSASTSTFTQRVRNPHFFPCFSCLFSFLSLITSTERQRIVISPCKLSINPNSYEYGSTWFIQ